MMTELTLTYFMARSNLVVYALELGELLQSNFQEKNILIEDLCLQKYFDLKGLSAPALRLYTFK